MNPHSFAPLHRYGFTKPNYVVYDPCVDPSGIPLKNGYFYNKIFILFNYMGKCMFLSFFNSLPLSCQKTGSPHRIWQPMNDRRVML